MTRFPAPRLAAATALALALFGAAPVLLPGPFAGTAAAQDALGAAKAGGQVGERPDGLAGALPGAQAAAQALVQQVNQQRLARYRAIAQSNGTSLDKVQAVAGQELISRTPAGQFVMNAAGQWVRK